MSASERDRLRALACCGGSREPIQHEPDCPSVVRAALSWIEDTAHGDKIRQRGEAAFELILAARGAAEARAEALAAENERLREALDEIARGHWNFGNETSGLTVMGYAKRVLRREPA